MHECFLLNGKYPKHFTKAWESFPNSENVHPSLYRGHQQYGVIVMEHCGQDLEAFAFSGCSEIISFVFFTLGRCFFLVK